MTSFSQDWFSHNIEGIEACLKPINKINNILEIGSFEGKSSCYWLKNVLPDNGVLHCVDNFGGSLEHTHFDFKKVKSRFEENTAESKKPNQSVFLHEKSSVEALAELICKKELFDLIYVDGSHTSADTLSDAIMSWNLLRVGGLMIFDDYLWEMHTAPFNSPKWGIDTFVTMFCPKLTVLMHSYQVAVIKTN